MKKPFSCIKVCGMRQSDNIRQVEALGIDMMGFIFWEPSTRYVAQKPDLSAGLCPHRRVCQRKPGIYPVHSAHLWSFLCAAPRTGIPGILSPSAPESESKRTRVRAAHQGIQHFNARRSGTSPEIRKSVPLSALRYENPSSRRQRQTVRVANPATLFRYASLLTEWRHRSK